MDKHEGLAQRFEAERGRLRGVAYRMLGSLGEAEDAVQEAWLRLSRADSGGIDNLEGWLTTVVARVCLDMLRSRKSRGEQPLDDQAPVADRGHAPDPEEELLLADSVGLALLVVLDTLEPAERLAFVLHDMFDLSFDEIAPIVGRSTAAARQLASRARRRVRGAAAVPDIARQREVVGAFLAAARGGDFEALVSVLDPDVVFRPDPALRGGPSAEVRGAQAVAKLFSGRAQAAHAALVNGAVGVVVAPRGRLFLVLGLKISAGKISEVEVIADPARLRRLDLAVLDG
ncbi:MAG TPA: sigma-70 family RNA polymerase sigma factor [Bradyrhizobium sp.]|nr:sigma-70 family RNA polymerase sigma factor [Bradyrhizobium sp.]